MFRLGVLLTERNQSFQLSTVQVASVGVEAVNVEEEDYREGESVREETRDPRYTGERYSVQDTRHVL